MTDRRRVTVLVDPADLHLVSAACAELEAQVGGIEHCDVQADRRVGPGGAIVRTLESEVDATVDTQLERAREVIQAELGGAEPSGSADCPTRTASAPDPGASAVSGELLPSAAGAPNREPPREQRAPQPLAAALAGADLARCHGRVPTSSG